MQRHHAVLTRLEAQGFKEPLFLYHGPHHLQRIDHDVAHPLYLPGCYAFPQQVFVGIRGWGPEDVCKGVSYQPVYLLRHGAIKGPQTGLEVGDQRPSLIC